MAHSPFFKGKTFLPLLICLTLGSAGTTYAQQAETDSTDPYKPVYSFLPLVYYTPETGLGLGGGAVASFRYRGDKLSSTPSQAQLAVSYTLKNQILAYLSYRTFYKDDKFLSYGELGYYRYIYKYYGNGPETTQDADEQFSFTLPRFRLNFLYRFFPSVYGGIRYWYDDFDIYEVDTGGILDTQPIVGRKGGRAAGLGLVVNVDSRDDQFYPSDGWYVEAVALPHSNAFGSDFVFTRFSLDVATYLTPISNQVLALNFYAESNVGEVPFHQMAQLGGTRRLRGLYQGRYRDNNSMVFQVAYRWMFLERFGAVAFYGMGNVAPQLTSFAVKNTVQTYGGGVRFKLSKDRKLNLRGDVGFSPGGAAKFYLTFSEAF